MIRRLLLFAGLAAAAALAPGAPNAQPSADWTKRTKERVELLLGPKRDVTPPPATLPNPFRLPGKPEPEITKGHTPADTPRETDADALARLVATLKINGLVRIGGVPQVIINQLSYREGDLVAVRSGEQATYLRVVRIAPSALILELNKVEQTVSFK